MTATLTPENEARLRQAIQEKGLEAAEEEIVSGTVECAALSIAGLYEDAEPGVSRLWGLPDLPPGIAWPRGFMNRYKNFLLQINLGDLPDFAGNDLPRRGMFYFFLGDWSGEDIEVLYADVDPATLAPAAVPPEEELEEPALLRHKSCRLAARAALDLPAWCSEPYETVTEALQQSENSGEIEDRYGDLVRDQLRGGADAPRVVVKLLGQPNFIGYVPEPGEGPGADPEWRLLAMLDSDRQADTLYGDAGYLQAFIPREDLLRGEFGRVEGQVESS